MVQILTINDNYSNSECAASATTYSSKGGDAWFYYTQPDNGDPYYDGYEGHISAFINVYNLGIGKSATATLETAGGTTLATATTNSYDEIRLHAGNLIPGNTY